MQLNLSVNPGILRSFADATVLSCNPFECDWDVETPSYDDHCWGRDTISMHNQLTHIDDKGQASMVDVSAKPLVKRTAIATGFFIAKKETLDAVIRQSSKG